MTSNETQIEPSGAPLPVTAERFHQLDGLRTVAVLLVMFHHAFSAKIRGVMQHIGNPRLMGTSFVESLRDMLGSEHNFRIFLRFSEYVGNLIYNTTASGVELFFVLSGVVLLRPYLRAGRPLVPGTYFRRRIERLWPPFLAALLLEVLCSVINDHFPTWYDDREFRLTFLGVLLQLPIMHFSWEWFNVNWRIYNSAWWSLTIELLFYLVVPVLIPLCVAKWMDRKSLMITFVACALLGAACFSFVYDPTRLVVNDTARAPAGLASTNPVVSSLTPIALKHETRPWDAFLLFAAYSQCFLLGIAIAKYDWTPKFGRMLLAGGIGYVLLAMYVQELNFHVGYGMVYGGIVILGFRQGGWIRNLLSKPIMVWIGERSYSLFLIHFTAYFLANYVCSYFFSSKSLGWGISSRLGGIALAFFMAMLMFHIVERRFARNLITAGAFWPRWSKL